MRMLEAIGIDLDRLLGYGRGLMNDSMSLSMNSKIQGYVSIHA